MAEEQNAGCMEGCDRTPRDPAMRPTAGQMLHQLHDMSPADQVAFMQRMLDASETAVRCFTHDHEGRLLRDDYERSVLLWLHAEAVWQRDQLDAEALKWTEVAGEHAAELESERKIVEQWERGHQNEVLPYTAALEGEIAALRAEAAEERSSRQAWAEEAMRLDTALDVIAEHCEELSAKADTKIGEVAGADLAWAAWGRAAQWMRHARNQRPCSLPECVVHPASSSVLPEGEAQ